VIAAGTLLIVGLGAAVVELLGPAQPSRVYVILSGAFALGAAVFIVIGRMLMQPDRPRTEHATEAFMTMVVFGAAFAADVVAVLEAGAAMTTSWAILGAFALWILVWLPASMRSVTATTTMFFARDVSTVFDYLSDFRTQLEYAPNVMAVEKISGGPLGLGTRFLTRVATPSGYVDAVDTIVEFRKDTQYASVVEGALRPSRGVATFQRVVGGTEATYRFTSTLSYSSAVLGMGIFRAGVLRRMRAARLAAWSGVKEILENPQTAAADDDRNG
jgi:hypothetical protein